MNAFKNVLARSRKDDGRYTNSGNFVLVNTLPAKYRRVIASEQEDYTQIGLVMVIISAILLNGGSIKQGFFDFCYVLFVFCVLNIYTIF